MYFRVSTAAALHSPILTTRPSWMSLLHRNTRDIHTYSREYIVQLHLSRCFARRRFGNELIFSVYLLLIIVRSEVMELSGFISVKIRILIRVTFQSESIIVGMLKNRGERSRAVKFCGARPATGNVPKTCYKCLWICGQVPAN